VFLFILDCSGLTFHLPNDMQVTDYVQYKGSLPAALTEGTVCMWLEIPHNISDGATPMSYAVDKNNSGNDWWVHFERSGSIQVTLGARGDNVNNFNPGQVIDWTTEAPRKVSARLHCLSSCIKARLQCNFVLK